MTANEFVSESTINNVRWIEYTVDVLVLGAGVSGMSGGPGT